MLRGEVDADGYAEMESALDEAREALEGRALLHLTSRALGSAAEILGALLGYVRDGGIDARWAVVHPDQELARMGHLLYQGLAGGDAGGLADLEAAAYERALAPVSAELAELVDEGDVVFLHGPVGVGLAPELSELGARVVWRSHTGTDPSAPSTEPAREFLLPYLRSCDAYVFSRAEFAWPPLDSSRCRIVTPSINPVSAKNRELEPETIEGILGQIGLVAARPEQPLFTRLDGTTERIDSKAEVLQEQLVPESAPLILHISSWDRLKDPVGLVHCFGAHCHGEPHLVLAGPDPAAPDVDPGSQETFAEVRSAVEALAPDSRRRVHLVALPVDDLEVNALMANAIERRADIVVRKSFSEGFGLALAEAMWKRKPVVASRVGGIQDLVVEGETGLLIDDPRDHRGFADAVQRLIGDRDLAAMMGAAGRHRIADRYLVARHLARYLRITAELGRAGRSS